MIKDKLYLVLTILLLVCSLGYSYLPGTQFAVYPGAASFVSGSVNVPGALTTAVVLPRATTRDVLIKNAVTNPDTILVGTGTAANVNFPLAPGQSIILDTNQGVLVTSPANLDLVYFIEEFD